MAEVKVLKDLTLGLTESAMETVKTWRYKPATKDGKPVSVYMKPADQFLVAVGIPLLGAPEVSAVPQHVPRAMNHRKHVNLTGNSAICWERRVIRSTSRLA